jgi:hypothetical protein
MLLPQPLNALSQDEVYALIRLLDIYVPDQNLRTALSALKSKLSQYDNLEYVHHILSDVTYQLNTDGSRIVILSRKDSPMLKFLECPRTLNLGNMTNNSSKIQVTVDDYHRITINKEAQYGNPRQSIFLSAPEAEVLGAFLIYHQNEGRGDHIEYVSASEQEGPQEET